VALLLHEWAGTSKGVNESVEVRLSKAFDVALQVRHHLRNSPGCVNGSYTMLHVSGSNWAFFKGNSNDSQIVGWIRDPDRVWLYIS